MSNSPAEATSKETYLEDLDRQIAAAHNAGAFTAVLKLARDHQNRLQHEFADLTKGRTLRWVPAHEHTELSPVAARINRVLWELRQWDYVADRAGEFAANEAHGWTILPDGTAARVLDNGNVISTYSSVRYVEDDGTVVDSTPDEQWLRRHQRHVHRFGDRVRSERLTTARRHARPPGMRARPRGHRSGITRRASSSSTSSGTDPGDPEPAEPSAGWPICPSCGRAFPWRSTLERCALLGCRRWQEDV
jgi:hypothetical protein